ncbi:MATE family efflux transporter [Eubacterium sp. am_0171]|uniref:Polysaccharide biosynthesis protein n=1 Tax=Faecalicatena contorta TaxID=39482 RepID=A0A174HU08_9FIRM|nr:MULTISPECIES: MATE family efflux transporter [Clostridia]MSC84783.1 oligosaccharide flippase family protein [Eubacterium sp. BIOML-A1]MSD06848.1 oligosaccharide flippase family protein [Eubacterium sp. BIOML-A2]RYT17617.1 MATE family efflux transporter [Eubacterium sp. am_0171]CUO77086.1 Polysaccharide biosynthesis protein [[Eubacterium] contortum] [Faecalicatena contorta]
MKNKQLFINMISSLISFGVNLGINLLLTPYIIAKLGSEAYSFIPIANNFIQYISIFTAALNAMASRFITIELQKNNNHGANEYFTSVLIANTVLSMFLTIPGILMVLYIDSILNVPIEVLSDVQITFTFVGINLVISLIGNVFSVATFAKNKLYLSSLKTIQGNLARVLLIIVLFVLFKPHLYYVSLSAIVSTAILTLGNLYYTKRLLPEIKIKRKFFKISAIKELLMLGVWNSINQLSVVLLTSLDLLIANVCLGATAGGQFSIAKNIPTLIQSLVGVLVSIFIPEFTILYAKNEKEKLSERVNFSVQIMGWLITLPIAFLMINGKEFFMLWVPGEDAILLHKLSLLTIIPMIITGSVNTIFNVYTVTGKLKTPALVLLVSGIFNVSAVLLLLRFTNLGIFAIPLVAALVGIIRNTIFTPLYAAKCLEIKWYSFYIAIIKGIFCTITMCIICIIIKQFIICNSWVNFIFSACISVIITMPINFIILFSKKDRKSILELIRKK